MRHAFVSARLRSFGLGLLAVILFALSVTGCVRLLEPRQSDATYYLLTPPKNEFSSPTDATGLAVGLRQPRMASYLTATRIVTRRGPHTIRFSEFHRWAEDLSRGINRTVALALAERSGIQRVETVPWSKGATFDYVVQLQVLAFEGRAPPADPKADENAPAPKGHSQMTVQWTILRPEADTVLARGHTQEQMKGWRVGDYAALASRLERSLDSLATDVGARLDVLARR
ncbi:MAG: membrane integrity-associated transporter subunit PqiC [Salinibacter sp.]